ncbi:biotin--[acetyl-CoA-carboxylase] ligase [Georgenia sp. Z1491]|uniref:biotin--[acetyl-CoA-carboxylase] ligase n=1 Tax=Georgenia sp. Z1491 TaxID=3416707 RepID=UPI003CF77939
MSPFSRVVELPSTGSTNADALALADTDPDEWPHLSVLVAQRQTAGRGRAGREWLTGTGAGDALTASVVLRVDLPPVRTTWIPLVVALAVRRALTDLGAPAATKWPNDVVLLGAGTEPLDGWGRSRKVAGILVEVSPRTRAIVVGIGINVAPGSAPVAWGAGLGDVGIDVTPAQVLEALGAHLPGLVDRLVAAGGDADAAALAEEVAEGTVTLGKRVRVTLPDDTEIVGTAGRLDPTGALVVIDRSGVEHVLVTGDVTHLRFVQTEPAVPAGDGTAGDGTVLDDETRLSG